MKEPTAPQPRPGTTSGGSPTSGGAKPPDLMYGAANDDIHILDRLAIIYRYRSIVLTVFVLASAAMMIQGYSNVQVYQARAQILIEDERSTAVPGITSTDNTYYEDPEPYYKTQYKILMGRDLTRRVTKKLHLEDVPEYNGTAVAPTGVPFLSNLKQRVTQLVSRTPVAASVEAPKIDETPDESALVSAFIRKVAVIPVTGSRLVDVTFNARDPKFAALAVNTLVDEYVDQNLALKLAGTQNMIDWLEQEVIKQQAQVQDSERGLAEYRDKQNALSLDDKQNIVLSRLNKLNDDVMTARTKKAQKEVLYNQIRAISGGQSPENIPAVGHSAAVQTAKARVIEAQRTREALAAKYGEKHPNLLKANGDLQEAQRQYEVEISRSVQQIKNDYDTALLEEQTMARALEAAKADAQDLSKKSVNYNVMEREANSNRQVYESLLQRANELRVSSNSRQNNVRVVDHAEVPKGPMAPAGRRTWLLSLGVGLVLAVGVAYGLDYMNDTIKTPEDVTRRLKLPFLGLVPSVRGDKHPMLASAHVPHDFGESFREIHGGRHQDRAGHQRTAARREDHDGREHRHGAGVWRVARAAGRRRHAPARSAPPAAADQRARAVPGAHRPGARARRHSAHGRSEPAGDHGRQDAPQSLRAARVRTHEDAPDEPVARALRLDHHRHAAGARGHRCGHPGAGRLGRDHRDWR